MFGNPEWLQHGILISLDHSILKLKHSLSNTGRKHVTPIFITTKNESEEGNTSDDWLKVKQHCIDCPVEIDVL